VCSALTVSNTVASLAVPAVTTVTMGEARIFSRVQFTFLEIVDDLFFDVALKTQAKTATLTTPTLQISPAQQKKDFLLCLGTYNFSL